MTTCHFALLSSFRMKPFYCFSLFCGKSYCDICKISHWQTASACKHDVFKTGNKRTILRRLSVRPRELETISNFSAVFVYLTVEYRCGSLQHLRPWYPASKYMCVRKDRSPSLLQSCQEVRRTSEWNWLWRLKNKKSWSKCRDNLSFKYLRHWKQHSSVSKTSREAQQSSLHTV